MRKQVSTTILGSLLAGLLAAAAPLARADAPSSSAPASGTLTQPQGSPAADKPDAGTPPAFLDDVEGARALAWVAAENGRSLGILQGDPRYAGFRADALALAEAHDRIPVPDFIGNDVYNFWQDQAHVRGIWRRTSLASYLTATPHWTTVIDLDALSASEHRNWVWEGADCALPAARLCLVRLSDGGEDATTLREFDLADDRFVAGGFDLSRSKQEVSWDGDDALLVSREWGPGTLTHSGYGYIVKRLARGAALGDAREVFRGSPDDVSTAGSVLVDGDGHRVTVINRGLDFFHSELLLQRASGLVRLDVPAKAAIEGFVADRLLVKIDEAWHLPATAGGAATPVPAGSLVSFDLGHAGAGTTPTPVLVFAPGPRQSLEDVGTTHGRVVAVINDNVRGQGWSFAPRADGGWTGHRLALPDNVTLGIVAASDRTDQAFYVVTGFLTPSQLWLVDAASGATRLAKSTPARFDASKDVVEQHEAVSTDGTRIPYFLVHPKGMVRDGHNPTELYAYGGFQVSMTPTYDPTLGRLWLAHGGVYALANIRGGGEFGPSWHDAALKTHRQRAFDDFAAVGRDLVSTRVTDTAHLGIRGGSNGGLLMGVEMTQHPELWHAVVIEVPLLDMLHFETMSAGASWVGEYGSVSVPAERAFLASISPLQNLKAGVHYPTPFIFTTTKDDRVGPMHARRFAWKMHALGLPFLYYEETEGGHAAGANLQEVATERALEYTYLARMLMPADATAAAAPAP